MVASDGVTPDGVTPEGPVDTLSPEEAKESRSLRFFAALG